MKNEQDAALIREVVGKYCERARACEAKGQPDRAARLYLGAAGILTKSAPGCPAEIRAARYDDAERLVHKADALSNKPRACLAERAREQRSPDFPDAQRWFPEPAPDVSFDDVVGLEEAKAFIRDRVLLPMRKPHLYKQAKLKPASGLLLFSLHGCGKTTFARACARESGTAFFNVHPSDIMAKYVGEAEQRVRSLFQAAREAAPSIIYVDEADGLLSDREDGTGVSKRVLDTFLAEMAGFSGEKTGVFVLAATNHPWKIADALRRPGRLSDTLYIPLPDQAARRAILEKQFDGVARKDDLWLDDIAAATDGFSGADVVELADRAKVLAVLRADRDGGDVVLKQPDLEEVCDCVRPSVDLSSIEKLRAAMVGHGYPVPDRM